MSYYDKMLKYKAKYLALKNQLAGANNNVVLTPTQQAIYDDYERTRNNIKQAEKTLVKLNPVHIDPAHIDPAHIDRIHALNTHIHNWNDHIASIFSKNPRLVEIMVNRYAQAQVQAQARSRAQAEAQVQAVARARAAPEESNVDRTVPRFSNPFGQGITHREDKY